VVRKETRDYLGIKCYGNYESINPCSIYDDVLFSVNEKGISVNVVF